jgi:MoaA/NifB/PqqE/SkfB family radical SAM enzyme
MNDQTKTLTKRGVIWLGQTCNQRCEFCYFVDRVISSDHPERAFMGLEKAKAICRTLVDYYGNTAIDIQGGEPTIYPGIHELVSFCREIGLAPTLITNALQLEDYRLCEQFKVAGVSDFLVSIQGIGDVHDQLVGVRGAHQKQLKALLNLRELAIPFRFNTVMTRPAIPQLPEIARLAVESGARIVNFITFNPFGDQAENGKRSEQNVPRYSEVRDLLQKALDILLNAGIEVNVRYFPLCMLEERYRSSIYNFQQLSYDPHEWDFASWGWTGLAAQRIKDDALSPPVQPSTNRSIYRFKNGIKKLAANPLLAGALYSAYRLFNPPVTDTGNKEKLYRVIARLHAQEHCHYAYGKKCQKCCLQGICDGFHGDYAGVFGTDEAIPLMDGEPVKDPCFYVRKQKKYDVNEM